MVLLRDYAEEMSSAGCNDLDYPSFGFTPDEIVRINDMEKEYIDDPDFRPNGKAGYDWLLARMCRDIVKKEC